MDEISEFSVQCPQDGEVMMGRSGNTGNFTCMTVPDLSSPLVLESVPRIFVDWRKLMQH